MLSAALSSLDGKSRNKSLDLDAEFRKVAKYQNIFNVI